jgi:predicted HTH transcriptional regulator
VGKIIVVRQAVQYVLQNGELTIRKFEELCQDVNRRTLQRELKELIKKGVFFSEGATHQMIYRLKQ